MYTLCILVSVFCIYSTFSWNRSIFTYIYARVPLWVVFLTIPNCVGCCAETFFNHLTETKLQMSMVPANVAAKDETNPQTAFVFLCHFIHQTCNFIAFHEKILEKQYHKMSISSFCLQQNPKSNVSIRSDEKPFQLILSFVYFFP